MLKILFQLVFETQYVKCITCSGHNITCYHMLCYDHCRWSFFKLVTDLWVTARPMSLLIVWGELLCMARSVKNIRNQHIKRRDFVKLIQRRTKSLCEQKSTPVAFIETHCPVRWGRRASCMELRLGQGQVFGQTAEVILDLNLQN